MSFALCSSSLTIQAASRRGPSMDIRPPRLGCELTRRGCKLDPTRIVSHVRQRTAARAEGFLRPTGSEVLGHAPRLEAGTAAHRLSLAQERHSIAYLDACRVTRQDVS